MSPYDDDDETAFVLFFLLSILGHPHWFNSTVGGAPCQ